MATEIFPVVHILQEQKAVEQAQLALSHGADGVYLIDHASGGFTDHVFGVFDQLAHAEPDARIGMNLLGLMPYTALREIASAVRTRAIPRAPDMVWVDSIFQGRAGERTRDAWEYKQAEGLIRPTQLLGGVAFKYTDQYTSKPVEAAKEALMLHTMLDVITTSGSSTGSAPSVEKIRAMKAVADRVGKPLAVASGISLENITEYDGLIDQVLMATSIETRKGSGEFDEKRLRDSIQATHELS